MNISRCSCNFTKMFSPYFLHKFYRNQNASNEDFLANYFSKFFFLGKSIRLYLFPNNLGFDTSTIVFYSSLYRKISGERNQTLHNIDENLFVGRIFLQKCTWILSPAKYKKSIFLREYVQLFVYTCSLQPVSVDLLRSPCRNRFLDIGSWTP
jgi:hypothetical protein